jgi:quercetin dioxygenase-like cupin family protein
VSPRQPSIVVHLRGQHSGGQLAVVEVLVAAGAAGPPLHVHPAHAEGVYLLEGELLVQVRDELRTGRAGEFFFAPAGTTHTFANRGERDARLLVTCTPAGFERYFDRLAQGLGGGPPEDAIAVGPPIGGPAENHAGGSDRP